VHIVLWNIERSVFKVRVKWTNGVTADCLLMCWIMVKYSHFITWTLDNSLLHCKHGNRHPESIVWENSANPLIDVQKILYSLFSLFELLCFAAVPTYRFTSSELQQSLNSIYSSQPTGHERISCHQISCEVCEWDVDWWLYNSRTYNWAYCEVV